MATPLVVISDGIETWVALRVSHYFNTCFGAGTSLNACSSYWLGGKLFFYPGFSATFQVNNGCTCVHWGTQIRDPESLCDFYILLPSQKAEPERKRRNKKNKSKKNIQNCSQVRINTLLYLLLHTLKSLTLKLTRKRARKVQFMDRDAQCFSLQEEAQLILPRMLQPQQ